MGVVRITLFDADPHTGEPKDPITAEFQYDPNMSLADQGWKKIAITAGDDVGCGTVMLPLAMLTAVMTPIMEADNARNSPIILPRREIIKPN